LQDGNLAVSLLAAALVGSCIGFLPYNFHPATIFMGDTGSTFLGLMVSLLAIRSYQKTTTFMAILVPIIFLMVPLLDTALSVIRRLIEKKPIFKADKEHIHHKMLRERSQPKAVLSLYMATFSFGLIALGLKGLKGIYTLIALILVAIVTFIWVKNSGLIDWKRN
jgi:UDP-GlcNAc:undecaprenyl-phosphate GlcNAc-1-phosphate transferase